MPLSCSDPPRESDESWPEPDHVGSQELEVVCGSDHISFTVCVGSWCQSLNCWLPAPHIDSLSLSLSVPSCVCVLHTVWQNW